MNVPTETASLKGDNSALVIEGRDLRLTVLGRDDVTADYLSWLNDPHVLRFRTPKTFPMTMSQLKSWIEGIPASGDLVLAIRTKIGRRHIGNIALGTIQPKHRSAELSVMIGARDIWGLGYGTQAITLVTGYAFEAMSLRRLWAESPNPAFNQVVRKLGWIAEGIKREAFLLDGAYLDFECWSLLDREWQAGKGRLK